MQIYVVKQGILSIPLPENTVFPLRDIIYDNQIPYPYRLAVGMALLLRITERRVPAGMMYM